MTVTTQLGRAMRWLIALAMVAGSARALAESNPLAAQMGALDDASRGQLELLAYHFGYSGFSQAYQAPNGITFIDNSVLALIPLHYDPKNVFFARVSADVVNAGGAPVLPATGLPVPNYLYSLQASLTYIRRMGPREMLGLTGSIGTATDQLFQSTNELIYTGVGFYLFPSGEHNAWLILLYDSNNRPGLDFLPVFIPLPGLEYLWTISPDVHLTLGVPMESLRARISDNWSLSGTVTLGFAHARLAYVGWGVEPYIGYDWGQYSYLLFGRQDPRDRFVYEKQSASAGLRFPILRLVWGDVNGGYAFARSFRYRFQNQTLDQLDIAPGFEINFRLSVRYDLFSQGLP